MLVSISLSSLILSLYNFIFPMFMSLSTLHYFHLSLDFTHLIMDYILPHNYSILIYLVTYLLLQNLLQPHLLLLPLSSMLLYLIHSLLPLITLNSYLLSDFHLKLGFQKNTRPCKAGRVHSLQFSEEHGGAAEDPRGKLSA